jgi:transketolase
MSISANKIKKLEKIANVTAESHNIIGGLGSAVIDILGENYLVVMKRIGIKDVFAECGKNDELLRKYIMSLKYIRG